MNNDIFIDTNIASRFSNPADPAYINLRNWLVERNAQRPQAEARLMVSPKLIAEYTRSNRDHTGQQNIISIIGQLQAQGRLKQISNQQIKDFQQTHFTKAVERKLRSNHEDRQHIPVVLLSDRKFALAIDGNFRLDLSKIPGFSPRVETRPEHLPYREDWSDR